MQDSDVLSMIGRAKDLPTLSTVAMKVVSVATGKETSVKEVADLIEKDMALSAKILQVINSPFYGFSRGITSVSEAVGLMGFKQVGNLALGISVMGSIPRHEIFGFSFQEFWERSVGQAVAAVKTTAIVKSESSHSIFTTALLQDIGTCLLVRYMPLAYGYAMALAKERKIHIVQAEQEVMGTDHAEVGALLAERWNLPATILVPIRHHHFSEFGPDLDPEVDRQEVSTEVRAVNVSNLMTDVLYEEDGEERKGVLLERAQEFIGLDQTQVGEILESLPEEIDRAKSLFRPDVEPREIAEVEVPDRPEPIEEDEENYHDLCPECGSDVGLKFCGNCGTSLKVAPVRRERVKGQKKILVAEDSAATRTAISNMLRRMGYEVLLALDGEEAVELARKEQPELILMDVLMPIMDGIEALKIIRSDVRLRTTPVVMLTSVTDIRMVTEAIESGANDYIAKPFSVTLLTERVERYVHAR